MRAACKFSIQMRKVIAFFLVVLSMFSFTGCGEITEDYAERYADFLGHSLGDYVIVSEGTHITGDGHTLALYRGRAWTARYEHEDGQTRRFRFNNGGRFAQQVIDYARERTQQELRRPSEEIMRRYGFAREVRQDQLILAVRRPHDSVDEGALLHPQDGLQLNSATPQSLVDYWGFSIWVTLWSRDENYTDTIERFKALIRTLSDSLELNHIVIAFFLQVNQADIDGTSLSDIEFRGCYDRQTDTFHIKTHREQAESGRSATICECTLGSAADP